MAHCLSCVKCLKRCDCGEAPSGGWCEATVLSVAGGVAHTTLGAVQLGHNHTPRPGQVITVPCTSGGYSIGATPQHAGTARPRREEPQVLPTADSDAWPRPVHIGRYALSWATADGPQLLGALDPPREVHAGVETRRTTYSHIQQAVLSRSSRLIPRFEYWMAADEAEVFPFSRYQRRLTAEFPTHITYVSSPLIPSLEDPPRVLESDKPFVGPIRWRIKDAGPSAGGSYLGYTRQQPCSGPDVPDGTISVTGSALTLEVEAEVVFGRSKDGVHESAAAVAEGVFYEWYWVYDHYEPRLRFVKADWDDVVITNEESGGLFETVYEGGRQQGKTDAITLRIDSDVHPKAAVLPPKPLDTPTAPPEPIKSTALKRMLWSARWVPDIDDPQPLLWDYEVELPGVGILRTTATAGSITSTAHNDHPQPLDNARVLLDGAPLACSSWAVVRRAGGELGLLTCDGAALIARWPGAAPSTIDLTALLRLTDAQGQPLPPGMVKDALLESEYKRPGLPDHARIIWQAGTRAATLAPWDAWRDLLPSEWRALGLARPRTLSKYAALPAAQRPKPPGHGVAMQGELTPCVPDTAGLPRYLGESEVHLPAQRAVALRWPWAARTWQDGGDDRVSAQPPVRDVQLTWPDVPLPPLVLVARARGDLRQLRVPGAIGAAHWLGRAEGRAGLRYFAVPVKAAPSQITGLRVEHVALYGLPPERGTS